MDVRSRVQERWKRLSVRERRVLRACAKHSPDAVLRNRCRIVLSLLHGNSPQQIQRAELGSVSQVYRVVGYFVEHGPPGLADHREDNGEAKVTEEYGAWLLHVLAGSPRDHGYRRPTWTQELLVAVLADKTGIRVSTTTMSRLLKRLKVRLGRPKPVVGCPWKKSRKNRRLRKIRRLIADLPAREVVVYVDEVDIHLNPKIGPDYMLRGTQKTVMTPGKNQKRYVAGALNAKSGQLTYVEWERKTSDLFILLLWQLIKDYPRARCIHVVLDNYRIHTSNRTGLALAALSGRVQLHFLPPYCPDSNRIERLWKDLHDNVTRNHRCQTMDELMDEVRAYLNKRRQKLRHEYATREAA